MLGRLALCLSMGNLFRLRHGMRIVQTATSLQLLLDVLKEGSILRTFQQLVTQTLYEMSLDTIVSTWMSGTDVSWASVEDARYVASEFQQGS